MRANPSSAYVPSGSRTGGFTLVELMVTVAIVGILGAIAFPSFMSQVRKSRRSDGIAAMLRVQQDQERYRSTNSTYAASIAGLNTTDSGLTTSSEKGYYTIATAQGGTASLAYTITATAVTGSSQASDTGCTTLTMSVTSGTTTTTPSSCWSK